MKIIIVLFTVIFLSSCTNNQPRYIVIGTGDIPTILDTKTREVFSIQTLNSHSPLIYKTSLDDADK